MKLFGPVTDYIKKSILTNINDIVVMGATIPERLGQGSLNQVLTVSDPSYRPAWRSANVFLKTILTVKGQILIHNGVIPNAMAIGGSNYMILTSYAGLPTWQHASFTLLGLLTDQGDIIVRGGAAAQRLGIGSAYQILRVNAGGNGLQYITPPWVIDPFTTKGDIIMAGTGAVPIRRAIGSPGKVLGVKAAGDDLEYVDGLKITTTQGDLIKRGAAAAQRMPIGTAKQVLAVNDAANDLEYRDAAGLGLDIEYSSENGAQVNLLAADTTITTLDIGTRATGARLLVCRSIQGTKGGTAGPMHIRVKKLSGTAAISFVHDAPEMYWARGVGNNEYIEFTTTCVCKVTTGGTLVLELYGNSEATNFVIPAGGGQLSALVLKG